MKKAAAVVLVVTVLVSLFYVPVMANRTDYLTEDFYDLRGQNGSRHWAYEEMTELIAMGILQGYTEKVYDRNTGGYIQVQTARPSREITRAEFAKILYEALNLEPADTKAHFNDQIPSWAENAVNTLYANGIVIGNPDGTFRAGRQISRAEIAAMLVRTVAGETDTDESAESAAVESEEPAADDGEEAANSSENQAANDSEEQNAGNTEQSGAADDTIAVDDIAAANGDAVVEEDDSTHAEGTGAAGENDTGAAGENDTATADEDGSTTADEDNSTLADNAAAEEGTPAEELIFPDVPAGHWAYSSIRKASEMGLITGFPDGRFAPGQGAKRAEVMVMLYRYLMNDKSDLPDNATLFSQADAVSSGIESLINDDSSAGVENLLPYLTGEMAAYMSDAKTLEMIAAMKKGEHLGYRITSKGRVVNKSTYWAEVVYDSVATFQKDDIYVEADRPIHYYLMKTGGQWQVYKESYENEGS